jgi:hypothetical protein
VPRFDRRSTALLGAAFESADLWRASIPFYLLGLRLHFVRRTPEFVSGKSLLKMQKPADL